MGQLIFISLSLPSWKGAHKCTPFANLVDYGRKLTFVPSAPMGTGNVAELRGTPASPKLAPNVGAYLSTEVILPGRSSSKGSRKILGDIVRPMRR